MSLPRLWNDPPADAARLRALGIDAKGQGRSAPQRPGCVDVEPERGEAEEEAEIERELAEHELRVRLIGVRCAVAMLLAGLLLMIAAAVAWIIGMAQGR